MILIFIGTTQDAILQTKTSKVVALDHVHGPTKWVRGAGMQCCL
jgi:hypothetical protein